MLVQQGENVHVIVRRLFDGDLRRHFAGVVQAVSETSMRVWGYAFIFDASVNQYIKRPDRRVRIFGLGEAGNIINVIPSEVNIDELVYRVSAESHLTVTDGRAFSLDINEFSSTR